jgi:hypothetical protein
MARRECDAAETLEQLEALIAVRYLSLIISTLNHAPYSTLGYKLSWTLDSSSKSQSNTDLDFLVWRLR